MIYQDSFFDEGINRRGTNCIKWDTIERSIGHEVVPMFVADMDFCCPVEVTQALVERAQHPVYGYSEQSESAVEAMLGFMERRHGLRLDKKQQAMMPCVVTGLRAAVIALTEPGDRVIIQPPVYGPFYASVLENGRTLAECPLQRDENGRYTMNLDSVEKACREGAKLMLLCSPHNPVGRIWTADELTALLNVLERYGVTLISDEIHEDFVYEEGAFTPCLRLNVGEDAKLVSLTSASKTFNLAGLQQAVLFTRNLELKEKIVGAMNRVGVTEGNIFGMVASEAAYRYGDGWLDAMLRYVKRGEELARAELAQRLPKLKLSPLEATYLGWMDLRAYGFSTAELMRRTHEQGVAFSEGTFFGREAGEGFLRINCACPHKQIITAIERLERAVKE